MNKLYLSASVNKHTGLIETTTESYICLFVYKYCSFAIDIVLVDVLQTYSCTCPMRILESVSYEVLTKDEFEDLESDLLLPLITVPEEKTNIAGLCAVLRWAIKDQVCKIPNHFSKSLLGFRGGCLVSCTESSIWTKFCELQLPTTVTELLEMTKSGQEVTALPSNLTLLEAHLKCPVRTHNVLKRKLDIVKKIKQNQEHLVQNGCSEVTNNNNTENFTDSLSIKITDTTKDFQNLVVTEKSKELSLNHNYLEGIDLTLADVVVFPCIAHLIRVIPSVIMSPLRSVMDWYLRMFLTEHIKNVCGVFEIPQPSIGLDGEKPHIENEITSVVDKGSLYKRDLSHTKFKCKHQDPTEVLNLLQKVSIQPHYTTGICAPLNWKSLPSALNPVTGDLPQKRVERKCQQIESIVTATLKIAKDDQTIVEFCAGGGHVGLLLAYYLPKCKVILIENKESSLLRAKQRAETLDLKNLMFYQCNIDYFKGKFDLGVSLHACGVATDLVIQQCIQQQASFVCCPCCYGGIQNTHLLNYPLSKKFRSASITYDRHLLLAHCADRTEVDTPTADQGELCMGFIDMDRVHFAEEHGYAVDLTTLEPKSCSPKHNLLIGKAPENNNAL